MNVSDLQSGVFANANWIDALVYEPGRANWNWIAPTRNTLTYTFNVSSGLGTSLGVTSTATTQFNATQQAAARKILAYVTTVTGINFAETGSSDADLFFGACDVRGATTSGINSSNYSYTYSSGSGEITSLTLKEYVFLDNREFASQNTSPTAGNSGYETLLHEIGHSLGLKHPFEGPVTLPSGQDNTANTVMAYTSRGGPYSTFNEYDIAALYYLYGLDGIGGNWGAGTSGAYYTGTSGDETFTAGSGRTAWLGLGGNDKLILPQSIASSSFRLENGFVVVQQGSSTNYVFSDIETVSFTDNTLALADLSRALTISSAPRFGTASADTLTGGAGNDCFFGFGGNDVLDGGGGVDSALYTGTRTSYSIARSGGGFTIADQRAFAAVVGAPTGDGTDTLSNIERVKFTDMSVALDVNGSAGIAAKLIGAMLGRSYLQDRGIVGIALNLLDSGTSYEQLAGLAAGSGLFASLAGSHSNRDYVNFVYKNVVGSAPSASELANYTDLLDRGVYTQASLGVAAAETGLNIQNINLVGLQQTGIEYV